MVVSAAKIEANRRNAQKSTGPRTREGKDRSKLNPVKHGMRAETLVLLDEDAQALEDRRLAWRIRLAPGDDVEERLVDDAVVYTWMQDRARRAQASRINANITNHGADQRVAAEKEVDDLGRRLFKDRMGPLVFYPSPTICKKFDYDRKPTTSFAGEGKEDDDSDRPGVLVLSLQSTLLGCEWMLGEWAKLKAIIDAGQSWLSSDKLKAVRLLGKQPFDAIDERDVAMVFLASFVLRPDKDAWYWEIATELADKDVTRFRKSAAVRELDSLKPADAPEARKMLLGIIERATERLAKKAEVHTERARVMAKLLPDLLAFDDSREGESLRRYDLANGRGLARSLAELRRYQHSGPLSVVSGPLSVAGATVDAIDKPDAVGEQSVAHNNATNEATSGPLSVVSGPLSVADDTVHVIDEPNAPNEPIEARENVTNEATIGPLSVVSGPLSVADDTVDAIDEPNAPNEPTDARENAPNEPTDARENATNEPTVAAVDAGCQRLGLSDGSGERGEEAFEEGFSVKACESIQRGCEKVRLARAERLRELNLAARREAEAAMAAASCPSPRAEDPEGSTRRSAHGPRRGHRTGATIADGRRRDRPLRGSRFAVFEGAGSV